MAENVSNIQAWWGVDYLGAEGSATRIDDTVANWKRRLLVSDLGGVRYAQYETPAIQPVGAKKAATSLPQPVDRLFVVQSSPTAAASLTPGSTGMEDAALEEWEKLHYLFRPLQGQTFMKLESRAAQANARVCYAEAIELPGFKVLESAPSPSAIARGSVGGFYSGILYYPLRIRSAYPFWWDATAVEDNTAAMSGSVGTATVDVDSQSVAQVGAFFTVENMSGTITELKIQNTTHSYEFTITAATNFTNGDTFDVRHTNKQWGGTTNPLAGTNALQWDDNASSESKAQFWLHPGANTVTATAVVGAGTCTVEILHQAAFGTI